MKERKGWHYRGYLPHFDGYGAAQHVVFRTFHALRPDQVEQSRDMSTNQARTWIDRQLDFSRAGCVFDEPSAATIMEETLHYFDGDRFDLLAWCIMPNHIHVLLVAIGDNRLGDIVRTWKIQATKRLGRGKVFADDYFDRYIRNKAHMAFTLAYIETNPVKAGLCIEPDEWQWSSAAKKATGWLPKAHNCPVFLS
jgi:putative transposase